MSETTGKGRMGIDTTVANEIHRQTVRKEERVQKVQETFAVTDPMKSARCRGRRCAPRALVCTRQCGRIAQIADAARQCGSPRAVQCTPRC
jgi:hypothetical protein